METIDHTTPWHAWRVALAIAVIAAAPLARAAEPVPAVPLYEAVYEVDYKGKNVGTSQFAVRYDAEHSVYEFSSRTVPKGLLKLLNPNPVVERSQFRVADGRIRPVESWYEDGSRKGEKNFHIVFDWDRRVATVTGDGGRREVALKDASFDRGSLQIALMYDLLATGKPGVYLPATDDMPEPYEYTDNGEADMTSGVGELPTRSLVQQRPNSSRSTWLWLAPKLSYLPVRIEQRKNGEVQTALTLTSVSGLPAVAN
jgi:Protein of unknown function (DUF3108)